MYRFYSHKLVQSHYFLDLEAFFVDFFPVRGFFFLGADFLIAVRILGFLVLVAFLKVGFFLGILVAFFAVALGFLAEAVACLLQ